MKTKHLFFGFLLLGVFGCENEDVADNQSLPPSSVSDIDLPKVVNERDEDIEHNHVGGTHGGNIISIGADSYHAEAVFQENGNIHLFMLGQDETRVQEIDAQPLNGFITSGNNANALSIVFQPHPVKGDREGMTSQFRAQIPEEMVNMQTFQVTIPNLQIAGERFRIAFETPNTTHAETTTSMPAGAEDEEAMQLYLTPGGIYTLADIEANGHMTAAKKFKGVMSAHDMKPKTGDRICPITLTKANPSFNWIIGGKSYLFCCPPCVDEFVKLAKEEPEKILDPEDYVKSSSQES